MCTVIWPDWPWPSPPLDPPAPPPVPEPSERPDETPVSHPDPSMPQKHPSETGSYDHIVVTGLAATSDAVQEERQSMRESRHRVPPAGSHLLAFVLSTVN